MIRAAKAERRLEQQWQVAREDVQLIKKIGSGSFGLVYSGMWHGTEVAVKVVKDDVSQKDKQTAMDMLKKEAKTLTRVHHPNVVVGFC